MGLTVKCLVISLKENKTLKVNYFLKFISKELGSKNLQLSSETLVVLQNYDWPGNVRELKNVIERACIIFPGKEITSSNVYENLLRLKVPSVAEEQDALWEMTADLSGITNVDDNNLVSSPEDYLPHPKNYKNWFSFYDEIDLRRHLQDVEIILIEESLEKTNNKKNKLGLAGPHLRLAFCWDFQ